MAADRLLDEAIRKVPDFPKPGILFYDITGILARPDAFAHCINRMASIYDGLRLDAIAAVESRGFVFAAPFALRRRLPLVLLRKKGKLPGETWRVRFTLEYGEDQLEVQKSDVSPGMKVLLVDDLVATGGTLQAAVRLLEQGGAQVVAVFGVVGLPFLSFRDRLSGVRVTTLIDYHGENAVPSDP